MEVFLLSLLFLSQANVLYQFSQNFGQIIVDSLGGRNCAINGISSDVDAYDIHFGSRGAYFSCCKGIISLPKNECYNSALGKAPFSIGLWLNSNEIPGIVICIRGTLDLVILRGDSMDLIKIKYSVGGNDYGKMNNFRSCIYYLAQWLFLLITISTKVEIYINTVLQLTNEQDFPSEFQIESITLGGIDGLKDSFSGIIWYAYYTFSIVNSEFIGQSTDKCLVIGCSACFHSILDPITNDYGCLDTQLANIADMSCPSACFTSGELGCIKSKCLKCNCGSCSLNSSGNCNCETSAISTLINVCDCSEYSHINSIEKNCQNCLVQCKTCSNSVSCDSCKDINAIIDPSKACVCKNGFWGNLTSLNGVCLPCKSDCLTCNKADSCLTCAASNSAVNISGDCECHPGYFGNYPLVNMDSCEKCAENCVKCSNKLFYQCITCNKSYYFYGMCLKDCPFGYHKQDESKCVGSTYSSQIMHFGFNTLGNVFNDKLSNLTAIVNNSILQNSSDSVYYKTIPGRGIYLKGLGIEIKQISGQSLLSAQTSAVIWLKPNDNNSSLFYKGNDNEFVYKVDLTENSIAFSIKIDNTSKLCNADSLFISQSWHHIFIVLNYSNFSTVSIIHNGLNVKTCTYEAPPFLDYLDSSFYIGANINSSSFFNGYIYEYSQFLYQPSISDLMSKSCNGCEVCLATGQCIQNCSYNQFYSSSLEQCIDCTGDCPNGCTMPYSCNICVDEACLECTSFSANSCSKCMDRYEVVNGTCSKCQEGTYYDYNNLTCERCKGLCTTCVSASVCLSCKEKSEINSSKVCQCVLGFAGNETCEQEYFKLSISVRSYDSIGLIFSEPLSKDIIDADIKLAINNTELKFSIQKFDDSTFFIQIRLTEEISENNNEVSITILKDLTSASNKILLASSYSIKLLLSPTESDYEKLQQKMAAAKNLGDKGSIAGASVSLGFSIFNLDLSTMFNFMNTAEMFYCVYLFNIELDPVLSQFLLATRLQSKIPNIFSYLVDSNKAAALDKYYIDYGFRTNLLLLNAGVHFTMLVIAFTLGLILWLLNFNNWMKQKLVKVTNLFKYSIYLRLWLQVYLELSIVAVISLKYTTFSTHLQIIDNFISIIIILSVYTITTRCFKVSIYNYYQSFNELLISIFYLVLIFKPLPEIKVSWEAITDFCIKLIFTAWGLNIFYSLSLKVMSIVDLVKNSIRSRKVRPELKESKVFEVTEAK